MVDPSTEQEVASVPAGAPEDVDVAVAAARAGEYGLEEFPEAKSLQL